MQRTTMVGEDHVIHNLSRKRNDSFPQYITRQCTNLSYTITLEDFYDQLFVCLAFCLFLFVCLFLLVAAMMIQCLNSECLYFFHLSVFIVSLILSLFSGVVSFDYEPVSGGGEKRVAVLAAQQLLAFAGDRDIRVIGR